MDPNLPMPMLHGRRNLSRNPGRVCPGCGAPAAAVIDDMGTPKDEYLPAPDGGKGFIAFRRTFFCGAKFLRPTLGTMQWIAEARCTDWAPSPDLWVDTSTPVKAVNADEGARPSEAKELDATTPGDVVAHPVPVHVSPENEVRLPEGLDLAKEIADMQTVTRAEAGVRVDHRGQQSAQPEGKRI